MSRSRLIRAIASEETEAVKIELANGADISCRSLFGSTALHTALSSGNCEITNLLFDAGFWWLDAVDCHGLTPLHVSIHNHDAGAAFELISAGSPVSQPDGKGNTPLHATSVLKPTEMEIVTRLVREGSNIHARNEDGRTPLHLSPNSNATLLLISAGADVSARDNNGDTPLHLAVARGDKASVSALIAAMADANAANDDGLTPLHQAMLRDTLDTAVIEELVAAGVDVCALDNTHNTPLHLVLTRRPTPGHELVALGLLTTDVSAATYTNKIGKSPLHYAASHGFLDVVKALTVAGSAVDLVDSGGNTPLHFAFMERNNECVIDFLMQNPRSFTNVAANNSGSTLLHVALRLGYLAPSLILISAGADVSARDAASNTPLHLAAEKGLEELVVSLIVSHKVDYLALNHIGRTPLHMAVAGHSEAGVSTAASILAAVASIGASTSLLMSRDKDGNTPLHLALVFRSQRLAEALLGLVTIYNVSETNNNNESYLTLASSLSILPIVKFLLANGASADTTNAYKNTPLHYSICRRDLPIATALAKAMGAELLSSSNSEGVTPLHAAVSTGSTGMVAMLVRAGANLAAENKEGLTPLQLAQSLPASPIEMLEILKY